MGIEYKNRVQAMCLVSTNGVVQYSDGFDVDAFAHVALSGVYTWRLSEPVEDIVFPGPRAFAFALSIADLGPGQTGIGLNDGLNGTVRTFDGGGALADMAWSLIVYRGIAAGYTFDG